MEMNELEAELEVLKQQVTALQSVVEGLAIRIYELEPEGSGRTRKLLAILAELGQATEGKGVGGFIRHLFEKVDTLAGSGADPLDALALLALQARAAGPDRQDALYTWLSQATGEELSDELRELLDQPKPAGDAGDKSSGGDS
uniref:Uncharacterized protein n=1 Tax=Marinobacter nauticus TaxID=2743 RepID=A0A455W7I9_MARNT|nr:hypothetical protein YBY_30190 [Marinobacter nauticus]